MKLKIAVLCSAIISFSSGCDGNTSLLTSPMNGQSGGQSLREVNDEAVKELGLEKGTENPPFMSWEFVLKRFHELKIKNSAVISKNENVPGKNGGEQ